MPRLLLVDDNPSIHKIAETLLASSDVQLVSCESGAQALALVAQGDRFDVALLDTSMLGMDGWALLERLRGLEATARMPVAMMAGVLDVVDPERLRQAPIQGLLKKPVELRDLADRVKRLLETPVPEPVPPAPVAAPAESFLTQPALRIPMERLVPPPVAPDPGSVPDLDIDFMTTPELDVELMATPDPDAGPDADLLLLGPEDLLLESEEALEPEVAEAPAVPVVPEVPPVPVATESPAAEAEPLDLEELDLEGLRGLDFAGAAGPEPAAEADAQPDLQEQPEQDAYPVPEFLMADTLPEAAVTPTSLAAAEVRFEDEPVFSEALPDLGGPRAPAEAPGLDITSTLSDAMPGFGPGNEPIDWSDDSDSMVGLALGDQPPPPLDDPSIAAELAEELDDDGPDLGTLSAILDPPPEPAPAAQELPPEARDTLKTEDTLRLEAPDPDLAGADPLAALLADPVLMDRLAKALVARLGDQVLREIAWEVLPDLADRLRPQAPL
jgi:two-component system cell cycle response regulator DivK